MTAPITNPVLNERDRRIRGKTPDVPTGDDRELGCGTDSTGAYPRCELSRNTNQQQRSRQQGGTRAAVVAASEVSKRE